MKTILLFLAILLFNNTASAQHCLLSCTEGIRTHWWTGFAIDDHQLLTVAHANFKSVQVHSGNKTIEATRIKVDFERDIALLSCKTRHGLLPIKLAKQAVSGVFRITGFPMGQKEPRILSYRKHTRIFNVTRNNSSHGEFLLSLDGEAFLGMSGSPVVNEAGELCGIQCHGNKEATSCASLEQIRRFLGHE